MTDIRNKKVGSLDWPDCMMPDGSQACIGYAMARDRIAELEAKLKIAEDEAEAQRILRGEQRNRAEKAEAEVARLRAGGCARDQRLTQYCAEAAEARAELAEARKDAERIDLLERCIRDGSYASIFNEIITVCQHAYRTIGTGPAFRSAIDAALAKEQK